MKSNWIWTRRFPMAAALSVLLSVIAVGGTLMETALVGKMENQKALKKIIRYVLSWKDQNGGY